MYTDLTKSIFADNNDENIKCSIQNYLEHITGYLKNREKKRKIDVESDVEIQKSDTSPIFREVAEDDKTLMLHENI